MQGEARNVRVWRTGNTEYMFRVIWVYTIFAHFHTIPSLYLLYIFSWTITAAAEILYFIRCCRRLRTAQTA